MTTNQYYLMHHGILGQKWGVRRYQNPDGTLTQAGKKRYGAESVDEISSRKGVQRRLNDLDKALAKNERDNADAVQKIAKKATKWHPHYGNEVKVKEETEKLNAKGRKEIQNLIDKYSEIYDISSHSHRRNVTKGKDIVKGLLNGAIFTGGVALASMAVSPFIGSTPWQALAGAPIFVGVSGRTIKGKHYTVKDKKTEEAN